MSIKTAVITAAGKGTRLYPTTRYISKEMFPIGNKPIIDFAVEDCIRAGVTDIVVVYGSNKQLLLEYLINEWQKKRADVHFCFVPQTGGYGTAKAVESAKPYLKKEPFFVIFPDEIPISGNPLQHLGLAYKKHKNTILAVKKIDPKDCFRYGMAEFDRHTEKVGYIKEKPTIFSSEFALCGRFAFTYEVFDELEKAKEKNGEYYLTDAIENLINKEKAYASILTDLLDTGNPVNYVLTSFEWLLRSYTRDIGLKNDVAAIIRRVSEGAK